MVAVALLPGRAVRFIDKIADVGAKDEEVQGEAYSEPDDLVYRAKRAVDKTNRKHSEMEKMLQVSGQSDANPGTIDAKKLFRRVPPVMDVPHRYFPLTPASKWIYRVTGDGDLLPGRRWTMEVVLPPNDKGHGVLEVGFDKELSRADVWLEDGSMKIEGFPFVEPEPFFGNRPRKLDGEFLPLADRIVPGAIWIHRYQREVIHSYYDKRGRRVKALAVVVQKDRAQAKDTERVLTGAGAFDALKVMWLSRVEIKVKGRPVLEKMTTEPYRKETMWLAPGYGIVRREIEYLGDKKKEVVFDLVDYRRPGS